MDIWQDKEVIVMAIRLMGRDDKSFVLNPNENAKKRSEERNHKNDSIKLSNKTINMSGLNGKKDSVLMRKQFARKRAMKMINDAWAGDKKIDYDIDEIRGKNQGLKADISDCNDHIKEYKDRKEEIREYYGIENGDVTQADLDLLKKKQAAADNPEISFTEEEEKRLAELESPQFARYQEQVSGLNAAIAKYEDDRESAWRDVSIYNAEIRGIKLERLKFHGMLDAQKKADEVNEAASEDVLGMLTGEGKDHITESLEEKREEAKEKAEEKEEQEEKLEERREEKEAFEAQLEIKHEENSEAEKTRLEQQKDAREQEEIIAGATENFGDMGATSSQVKAQIKDMLHKMKLLEEDLKGAEVDDTV